MTGGLGDMSVAETARWDSQVDMILGTLKDGDLSRLAQYGCDLENPERITHAAVPQVAPASSASIASTIACIEILSSA